MVANTLKKQDGNNKVVEFKCGDEVVKLSPAIIRKYLVNGNGAVTDQEVVMFLNLCRFQHLNPFLKEAYLIKYGNNPATMVVGKDVMTKQAMRNPAYAGQQAGVVVLKEDGTLEERIGSLSLDNEQIVGGWAKVYIKGYAQPVENTVSFDEYCLKGRDGKPMSNWAAKPGTMIRKVALVQALREAFPEDLQALYDAEEMGVVPTADTFAPVDAVDPEPVQVDPPQDIHQNVTDQDDAIRDFFGEGVNE